jgi:4-amino-4-deoxy-L-arabinose transferase-like glycosyltransferase
MRLGLNSRNRGYDPGSAGWRLQVWHLYAALVGLVARVAFGLMTGRDAANAGWDGKEYYAYAQSLLAFQGDNYSRFFAGIRPPLYPIFLMPFAAVTEHVWPIQITQSLISVFTAFVVARVAGRWRGQRAGSFALLLVLFSPFLIYYSAFLLTETLFIALLWSGIACLEQFDENRLDSDKSQRWLTAGAVTLGLACLTRPTLQLFLIVAVVWIAWRVFQLSNLKTAVLRMAHFTIVVSLLLIPWMARSFYLHGEAALSPGLASANYALGNSPDYLRMYEAKTKEEYYAIFGQLITRLSVGSETSNEQLLTEAQAFRNNHRANWLRLQWYKFKHFWTPWLNPLIFSRSEVLISFFMLTPLFIFGAIELCRRKGARDPFLYLLVGLIAVGYVVGGLLFHVQVRYRIPFVDMSFILLTASFLGQIEFARLPDWLRKHLSFLLPRILSRPRNIPLRRCTR